MTNQNVVPFDFEGNSVRAVERDGDPWFVLADVCRVLEHSNPTVAASRLDGDEKVTLNITEGHSGQLGGAQFQTIINESGLYSLILTSRKPAAKQFKKWITAEVIPTIRKTGSYGTSQAVIPDLSDPVVLVQLLTEHASKRIEAEKRADAAEKAVKLVQPKAEFYDHFANAEGLYGLQNAGRLLKQGPNKFVSFLKRGYLFYQGGELIPKVKYREMGIFEVKSTMVEDKARLRSYITPRGLQYFAKKLGVTIESDLFNSTPPANNNTKKPDADSGVA